MSPITGLKESLLQSFKKNDPDVLCSYRGITLVSCLLKLLTGILNWRLNRLVENNDILRDAQFDFRSGSTTTEAIFLLNVIIQTFLN